MAITKRGILKNYFRTGAKPTEEQFGHALDSFVHKNDTIEMKDVAGLFDALNSKAEKAVTDLKDYMETDKVLPLGSVYVYYGMPVHCRCLEALDTDFDPGAAEGDTTQVIVFCCTHGDGSSSGKGGLYLVYASTNGGYRYYDRFTASTVPDDILRAFGEAVATTTADGLMSKEDKQELERACRDIERIQFTLDDQHDFIEDLRGDVGDIRLLIPSAASEENQLADRDFVNSSVATATADFKGTFDTLGELEATAADADANDYAFIATKDTTAVWDWQNLVPGTIAMTHIEGTDATGYVASDVGTIRLQVVPAAEGTAVKLAYNDRGFAQMNAGTAIRIPVKNEGDVITIRTYQGQHSYTLDGTAAASDTQEFTATAEDRERGYALMEATGTAYLYGIKLVQVNEDEGNAIYKRYKYVEGMGWVFEYTLNNSSFTSAQWAAINSAMTSGDVEKLRLLPTAEQIAALVDRKLDGMQPEIDDLKESIEGLEEDEKVVAAALNDLNDRITAVGTILYDISNRLSALEQNQNNN